MQPDAEAVERFRTNGADNKPVQGGMTACWGDDEERAKRTAYGLWPNEALPGELAQVLPITRHFEQASELVTPEMVVEQVPCGPDPERHIEATTDFAEAGFDELYKQQIGPDQDAFFAAYREHVLPRVRKRRIGRWVPECAAAGV